MIYINIKHILAGGLSAIYLCALCGTGILISTDKEQITNETIKTSTKVVPVTSISTTKIVTTAPIITTNIVSTTPITTTTTVTTTTTAEIIETECEESSDYEETTVYEEIYEEEYEVEYEEVYEETYVDYGWYTAKWYAGAVSSWGYSGRELISGYSVASPDFPQGTVLQITGGGLDGVYRVDDTGCPSGVIDFFYNYGDVPEHFEYNGVYDIQVNVIE